MKIGDKLYLKPNPFEIGDFLPSGEKVIIDIMNVYNSFWVKIEGYNDWIDIKWFKKIKK